MKYLSLLRDCDVAIITSPAALYYMSGIDMSDATIVLMREKKYYLTNPLYEIAVKTSVRKDFTVQVLSRQSQLDFIRDLVS